MSQEIKPKFSLKKATTAPKKERLHYSGWHMIINTNKKFTKLDGYTDDTDLDELAAKNPDFAEHYHKLEEAINAVFGDIKPYIRFMEPSKTTTLDKKHFVDFDTNGSFELGDQKSLHAHLHIEVVHRTVIRLDYEKIKKKIAEVYGHKVYFRTELLKPGQSQFAKLYAIKGV